MFRDLRPFYPEKHRTTAIDRSRPPVLSSGPALVDVDGRQLASLAKNNPVVFRTTSRQRIVMSALLNSEQITEALSSDIASTSSSTIPNRIRLYPFAVMRTQLSEKPILGLDEGSPMLNAEGHQLFHHDESPTHTMVEVKKLAQTIIDDERQTGQFIQWIQDQQLLTPLRSMLPANKAASTHPDLLAVSEEKLNQVDTLELTRANQAGWIHWITAHLLSLHHLLEASSEVRSQLISERRQQILH